MIYKDVELFNLDGVKCLPERPGVLLQRIPDEVLIKLREGAQDIYRKCPGGEIRFVSDLEPSNVTLISYGGKSKACLYFGDFQAEEYIIDEVPTTVEIPIPERLLNIEQKLKTRVFSPMVRRLILEGNEIHLINIKGSGIRPPKKEELPKLKYLAYGTSITQGISSTTPILSYVRQVAWRLGTDVINLGCSGNAFCEKEIADYLAKRNDWDFATLCLSVNMLNQGVSLCEFIERARYLVETIAQNNIDKPVVCISLFPYFLDKGIRNPLQNPLSTPEEYRKTLKGIVENLKLNNLYFIEGKELLKDFTGLSYDLLHPGNLGMIQIAENLAAFLRPILEKHCLM